MAVFNPEVTDRVADQAIQARQNIVKNRILPRKLEVIENLRRQKIHVFNVGPWGQIINTGSTGTFTMPPCPPEKEYVELLVDDGKGNKVPPISLIMEEVIIKSEDEYARLEDDGKGFAHAMLGEGRGQNPANSLLHLGMFVAEGEKPTKAELSAAKELVKKRCQAIYRDITNIWSTDRKLFSQVVRPEVHFVAARVLGLDNSIDSPWMKEAVPVGRVKCKMCGRVTDPDVAMCEGGHIVNQELYAQLQAQQEEILTAPKKRA